MSSISAQEPISDAASSLSPVEEVGVDVVLLQELGGRYAAYRQAITAPFDPVRALGLTGEILEAVRRILATTEHRTRACPVNRGRVRQ